MPNKEVTPRTNQQSTMRPNQGMAQSGKNADVSKAGRTEKADTFSKKENVKGDFSKSSSVPFEDEMDE